jgi:hypothetical protein
MPESLLARLMRQAEQRVALEREASLTKSVGGFVRLNLPLLQKLHRTVGTWALVSDLLSAEGLRWKNGKTVTGNQLRALVSAIGRKSERSSRSPLPPHDATGSAPTARRIADLSTGPQLENQAPSADAQSSRPVTRHGRKSHGLAALLDDLPTKSDLKE